MKELWNMVFGGQAGIGLTVNAIISLMFVVGVADILRSRRRLALETKYIREGRSALAAKRGESPDSGCPHGPAEAVLRFLNVPAGSLLGQRIARMIHLRLAGIERSEVLQQLTTERIDGYGSLARQIGASLTLLGLLGTVFGLSLALLSIGDASVTVKGIEDLSRLTRALAGTLGGMKTAFGCTLAGLLGAVALSYLNHMLRRRQSQVLTDMEELLVCDLLPAVAPTAEVAAEQFAQVLAAVSDDFKTLQSTVSSMAATHKEGSDRLASNIGTLNDVMRQLSEGVVQIGNSQSRLGEGLAEMATATTGVKGVMERSLKGLEEQLTSLRQSLEATTAIEKSIAAQLQHQQQFLETGLEQFPKSFERVVTEQMARNQKTLQDVLTQHLAELAKMREDQRQMMTAVSDIILDTHLNGHARTLATGAGK